MYQWLTHTGEAALAIEAASEEAVFVEAATALRELLAGGREATGELVTRNVSLRAPDRAALLADWLGELAFLAESEGFVPDQVEALELEGDRLRVTVAGHAGSPPHLVKAVTYHGLALARQGSGWRATVVLDV
jgi:SHS2 domain-containing protein